MVFVINHNPIFEEGTLDSKPKGFEEKGKGGAQWVEKDKC